MSTASALDALALCIRTDGTVPVLVVPEALGFEDLREWLRSQLPNQVEPLAHRPVRLDLGDREIKLFDLRRLLHLLKDEFRIDVSGLYVQPGEVWRYAERELKLKLFAIDDEPVEELVPDEPTEAPTVVEPEADAVLDAPAAETAPPPVHTEPVLALPPRDPADPGRRTLSVRRTLRSGATIRFDGDVVLFGDANPGAQIVAAGNIVVLGSMKGMAHAGATGDESAFILAFDLKPTQLRIGRKIAIPPEHATGGSDPEPEIATVVDGQIVMEPYRGKGR